MSAPTAAGVGALPCPWWCQQPPGHTERLQPGETVAPTRFHVGFRSEVHDTAGDEVEVEVAQHESDYPDDGPAVVPVRVCVDGQVDLRRRGAPAARRADGRSGTAGRDHRGPAVTGEERPELAHRDDWWDSCFMTAVKTLAATGRKFETYDVTEQGVPEPAHPAQYGSAMRRAAQSGLITEAGFTVSRRPSRSGGLTRLWVGTAEARGRPAA